MGREPIANSVLGQRGRTVPTLLPDPKLPIQIEQTLDRLSRLLFPKSNRRFLLARYHGSQCAIPSVLDLSKPTLLVGLEFTLDLKEHPRLDRDRFECHGYRPPPNIARTPSRFSNGESQWTEPSRRVLRSLLLDRPWCGDTHRTIINALLNLNPYTARIGLEGLLPPRDIPITGHLKQARFLLSKDLQSPLAVGKLKVPDRCRRKMRGTIPSPLATLAFEGNLQIAPLRIAQQAAERRLANNSRPSRTLMGQCHPTRIHRCSYEIAVCKHRRRNPLRITLGKLLDLMLRIRYHPKRS